MKWKAIGWKAGGCGLAIAWLVVAAAVAGGAGEPAEESPLEKRDRLRIEALVEAGLERQVLETARGRLVYWQGGGGPPLVLLHGSGDAAGTYATVAPDLMGDYRLLIPDLPGHGESEPAEGVLPFATIVGGLEALLDATDLEGPVLAGNSMGAWLAMLYAHKHPDRVERVVAINGGAILGEPSDIRLMPGNREEARASMAAIRDPSSPPIADEVLDDIVRRAGSGPIFRMMQDLGGMMAYLLNGKLGEISTPVEMLWGESDQLMKLSYAERMHAGLPRSRITPIPECGHIPQSECPERFVEALRQLLASEPPTAPEPAPEEPAPVEPEPVEPEPEAPEEQETGEGG